MAVGTYVLNTNTAVPSSFSSYSGSHSYNTSPNPRVITVDLAGANESINCYEISNEKNTAASNTVGGSLLNRLYPANTTITSYQETVVTSAGHRLRSDVTLSNLVTGSSLKTDYDYFVVLYADDAMLHHVAKITSVITYDVVGDGIEFTPALKSDIPKGTKFTIYRGPSAAQTDIVAVGYGLMGDTVDSASTVNATDRRHDNYVEVSRPTFYFYDDRISDSKGGKQLDYLTKYNLVKSRYYASATETTVSIFTTEANFGNLIQDKSRYRFQASIVDNLRTADQTITGTANEGVNYDGATTGATYTYDRTDWDDAHRNASRTVYTLASSPAVSTHHGPSRYIKYITSPEKTRVMLNLLSTGVYSSVTKSGNYAEVSLIDTNRMTRLKINPNEDMKVREIIFDESIKGNALMKLPGTAEARTSASTLYFTGLTDGQDLRLLLGTGPFDIIRLEDYYFGLSAVSAPANGEQNITISHRRPINNKAWSAGMVSGLLTDLTSKSTNVYRKAWSNVVDNMMCNFDIDTEYDGTTLTKINTDITSTPERSDIYGLNYIIQDRECSGLRFTVNLGDKNNGFIKFSDNTEDLYQLGSLNFFDYINGEAFIDKITFDGWIEFIENNNEYGIYTYTLKGRDDINKLLGAHVNKKYLYSSEYVYSTLSPVSDIVYSGYTTYDGLNTSAGFGDRYVAGAGRTLAWLTDGSVSEANKNLFTTGSRLYVKDTHNNNYLYLGTVYSGALPHASAGTCQLIDRVEIEDSALTNLVGNYTLENTGSTNHIKIYVAKELVVAGKSLSTNILHDSTPTTLKGAADKGINFISGKIINAATGVVGDNLIGSSPTDTKYNLGWPISYIKDLDLDKDSPIGFQIFNQDESTVQAKHTVSSMSEYEIITMEEVDGTNKLTVAPIMPIVLGRVDSNTSDTITVDGVEQLRLSNLQGIYLLNTNGLPSGGFLHLVNPETSSNITQNGNLPIRLCGRWHNIITAAQYNLYNTRWGTPLWRYIDLQKGNSGSIYYEDEIANRITGDVKTKVFGTLPLKLYKENKGKVQGYVAANRLEYSGTEIALGADNEYSNSWQKEGSPETRGILPAFGSLFDDITIAPNTYYTGIHNTGKREVPVSVGETYTNIELEKLQFESFDPKCLNWHLFSVGDIQPDSMGRMNHIGYKKVGDATTNRSFADYSVIIKSEGERIEGSDHNKYVGTLPSYVKKDESYEHHPITSASISPHEMKRFGMLRLIEATFDWHFNNVDVENLTDVKYKPDFNFLLRSRIFAADDNINGASFIHSSAITSANVTTGSATLTVSAAGLIRKFRTGTSTGGTATTVTHAGGGNDFTAGTDVVVAGQLILNLTTHEYSFITNVTATVLTTANTNENAQRGGWTATDVYLIPATEIYTDPYTDPTGKSRYIGTVDGISGTTVTLTAVSPITYNGELFFSYGLGEGGASANEYSYPIEFTNFNKHMITGRRLVNFDMYDRNANDFTYLSIDRLLTPPIFGAAINRTGSKYHAFRASGTLSYNKFMAHSRVIQEISESITAGTATYNNINRMRDGLIGVITKSFEPFTLKGEAVKDIIATTPDKKFNTNYGKWYYDGNGVIEYGKDSLVGNNYNPWDGSGGGYAIKFDVAGGNQDEIDDKCELLANNATPIFSHPTAENAYASSYQIRYITDVISSGSWGGKECKGRKSYANLIHAYGTTNGNFDNGEILVGDIKPYKLADTGMTVPIRGFGYIRGNVEDDESATKVAGSNGPSYPVINYNYNSANVFNAWTELNSDKLVPNYANKSSFVGAHYDGVGGVLSKEILAADFEAGEPNSYLGYDPEQLYGTKTNLTQTATTGAEMFYKCVLDIDADDVNTTLHNINTINGKRRAVIQITIDDKESAADYHVIKAAGGGHPTGMDIKNRWVHFVPNLTGYYLVSETGVLYDSPSTAITNRNINGNIPTNVHQIVSHFVDREGNSSPNDHIVRHYLEIDNYGGSISGKFRLMRIAETCFYDFSPNEIELFTMNKKYTKKPRENKCYDVINKFNSYTEGDIYYDEDSIYNEGVMSMYLPVEVDGRQSSYVVNRTASNLFKETADATLNLDLFLNGKTYHMLITDGFNKHVDTMRVDYTSTTVPRVKLTFTNMQETNGLASLGQVFQINIHNKPTIKSNRLSIGTAFNVVDEVEDIVNEVLETNNIVYTKSADTNRYYEAFDLQKIDLYTACNHVASYKDRKLVVDGSSIKLKTNIEDYDYTNITISDKGDDHDIHEIKTDISLFDFYNQVTVFGDEKTKGFSRDSVHQRENNIVKELIETDLTIQTQDAADKRANQLLKLHSESSIGVEFKMGDRNAKYIKPGNIIKLDLLSTDPDPLNDIIGEYMVLAVEHHLTETIKVTLGKYNMGLSERIAEIMSKGDKINSAIVGRNFRSTGINEYNFDNLKIRELKIKITRTANTVGLPNTLSFGRLLGFDTELGFKIIDRTAVIELEEDLT